MPKSTTSPERGSTRGSRGAPHPTSGNDRDLVRMEARDAWAAPVTSPALQRRRPDRAIEQAARDDPDAPLMTKRQLARARRATEAPRKRLVSLRIDADVLDRYRATGPGWQSRMHAVLAAGLGDAGTDATTIALALEAAAAQAAILARRLAAVQPPPPAPQNSNL